SRELPQERELPSGSRYSFLHLRPNNLGRIPLDVDTVTAQKPPPGFPALPVLAQPTHLAVDNFDVPGAIPEAWQPCSGGLKVCPPGQKATHHENGLSARPVHQQVRLGARRSLLPPEGLTV